MNLAELNKHFNPLQQVGNLITESEVAVILSNKKGMRIWVTKAYLSSLRAERAVGYAYGPFNDGYYEGAILSRSEKEALLIAKERPFGETVLGYMVDQQPFYLPPPTSLN